MPKLSVTRANTCSFLLKLAWVGFLSAAITRVLVCSNTRLEELSSVLLKRKSGLEGNVFVTLWETGRIQREGEGKDTQDEGTAWASMAQQNFLQ